MDDEILNEIQLLEGRIDTLEKTFINCTKDMLEVLQTQSDLILQMNEIMCLATSPSDADLERFQTLREAFDRYDFVRKLTLGKPMGE